MLNNDIRFMGSIIKVEVVCVLSFALDILFSSFVLSLRRRLVHFPLCRGWCMCDSSEMYLL